ncbi:MAG: hypothetical protein NT027_12580 [Proteobacteria bacterium]|nr:hypothetical protein [Pseudomonadota bacterium]
MHLSMSNSKRYIRNTILILQWKACTMTVLTDENITSMPKYGGVVEKS